MGTIRKWENLVQWKWCLCLQILKELQLSVTRRRKRWIWLGELKTIKDRVTHKTLNLYLYLLSRRRWSGKYLQLISIWSWTERLITWGTVYSCSYQRWFFFQALCFLFLPLFSCQAHQFFGTHAGEKGSVSNYCINVLENLQSWCHGLSSDDDTSSDTITGNRIVMVSKQPKSDQS